MGQTTSSFFFFFLISNKTCPPRDTGQRKVRWGWAEWQVPTRTWGKSRGLDILMVPPRPPSPSPFPLASPPPFFPAPFSGRKGCRHTGSQRNTASVCQHSSVASVAAEFGECAVAQHTCVHQLSRQVLGCPPHTEGQVQTSPPPHTASLLSADPPFVLATEAAAGVLPVLWDSTTDLLP